MSTPPPAAVVRVESRQCRTEARRYEHDDSDQRIASFSVKSFEPLRRLLRRGPALGPIAVRWARHEEGSPDDRDEVGGAEDREGRASRPS
jgi:hypothetical protein